MLIHDEQSKFITAGKYGEILCWTFYPGNKWEVTTLFSDPQYDFRDVYVDENSTIYALSYSGRLLINPGKDHTEITLNGKDYTSIIPVPDGLLLVSKDGISKFSGQSLYHFLQASNICSAVTGSEALLTGDNNGQLNFYKNNSIVHKETPYPQPVTALVHSPHTNNYAIGYSDGLIFLFNPESRQYRKLSGHRSAITQIIFSEDKLYTCSYDCTVRLWNMDAGKAESVVILQSPAWLHTITLNPKNNTILAGDENGGLHCFPVSPSSMANHIRQNLKREFTPEEWQYYVGSHVPIQHYLTRKNAL